MDINITCPVNSLGYGVVGLNVSLALAKTGHTPAIWFIGAAEVPEKHHGTFNEMLQRSAFYNASAPSLRIWHQFDLAQHVGKGPHCAMPIFELDRFKPVELHHLKAQDVVFANSQWAGEVLEANGIHPDRIQYAPLGVDRSIFHPYAFEREKEAGPTVFFNCGKWEYRKGHDVLLEAFNKAFEPSDDVVLEMNCHNPCRSARNRSADEVERYNLEWTRAYRNSKLGGKVVVISRRLPTQKDVADRMAAADCGVFPSRAEGWGLESAEMLAMGKHVILTDYSAHTEYADESNSLLIKVDQTEEAHDGHWFDALDPAWGGPPGRWAMMGDDQVDQLVEHMRRIHGLKKSGQLTRNVAGHQSMSRLTWENTVLEITSVLSGAS